MVYLNVDLKGNHVYAEVSSNMYDLNIMPRELYWSFWFPIHTTGGPKLKVHSNIAQIIHI